MSTPDGHLIRTAFLTKYGYSPDLTYPEILREFQKRYDHAQAMRLQNAGSDTIMLIIEGMTETAAHEEATAEREARKRKIARLSGASDYGVPELDQLIEVFAQRLEVEWIQRM
jgi:signal recognition particle GTPase